MYVIDVILVRRVRLEELEAGGGSPSPSPISMAVGCGRASRFSSSRHSPWPWPWRSPVLATLCWRIGFSLCRGRGSLGAGRARKLEAGSDLRFLRREYSFFSLLSSDLLPRPSLDSRAKLEILNPQKNSYPQTRRERKPNPDFPHVFQPDMRFSRGLVVCRVGKPPN